MNCPSRQAQIVHAARNSESYRSPNRIGEAHLRREGAAEQLSKPGLLFDREVYVHVIAIYMNKKLMICIH
jgi:hypothetical protein